MSVEHSSISFFVTTILKILKLNVKLPTFNKEIILLWQLLNRTVPLTRKDVLDKIVWNNIQIFQNQQIVCVLQKLFDESKSRFQSFYTFLQKIKIKWNFLQYHGLLSAVPNTWKDYFKQGRLNTLLQLTFPWLIILHVRWATNS